MLLHAYEPEAHGDEEDQHSLGKQIKAERKMQEPILVEERRGGDGEKDGE